MIIQSETIMSVVGILEDIAKEQNSKANKFLANALNTATKEGREEILNFEKNEYEVLLEKANALDEALTKVKSAINNE